MKDSSICLAYLHITKCIKICSEKKKRKTKEKKDSKQKEKSIASAYSAWTPLFFFIQI